MAKEIWKDIKGFEGKYKISSYGRVKSLYFINRYVKRKQEKILKTSKKREYLTVSLSKNNIYKNYAVHRLVAENFLENPENKKCVNHIDGDKHNNNIENLEWATYSENERHSYKILNKKPNIVFNRGFSNGSSKNLKQFDDKNNLICVWGSIMRASLILSLDRHKISDSAKKGYKYGGFFWKITEKGLNFKV